MTTTTVDAAIIGTGMGGGTAALTLAPSGATILMLERGDFLPPEPENWSPEANFADHRYKNAENWWDGSGEMFKPGVHYYVGGNTKVYGAALPRFRAHDFDEIAHFDGVSPAWPLSYDEIEPYYTRAEAIYKVHATQGEDPTDPPRSGEFPFPPVPHEPVVAQLADMLRTQGLSPFHLPLGLDLRNGGACIRCGTCDGYPCKVRAKSDAETCAVLPALEFDNVQLWPRARVDRLETNSTGTTVIGVHGSRDGQPFEVRPRHVLVACGSANSAALLLRSASPSQSQGLGNGFDQVGRYYMAHNNSVLLALRPFRRNTTTFQKTMAVNDFYCPRNSVSTYPLGNLQLIGKVHQGTLKGARPRLSQSIRTFVVERSIEWWVMSEDLPLANNRVSLSNDGSIVIHWTPTNMKAHRQLLSTAKRMMRRAGYPLVFSETMGIETNSHQCGTLRMGTEANRSVVDPMGRVHGLDNVIAVDSSVFVSSSACNPALTIAALSLRACEHLAASW
ncbi:GMC oxidoreductase [Candidatus Poriferisodalis sp.]|uniref:GMC oxidoreductase n=1 Tax=Candidatus Poriferisodalis sp. TaxID=3101277 RepID=UPI003B01D045